MLLATPEETEYLSEARAGNSAAFSALVEPYRKPLLVHCYRLSGSLDEAEDIVQDTFFRAWNKIKSFKGQGSLRNWLYVIATRLWLDESRKQKRVVLLPLDGDPADPDTPPLPPRSSLPWLDPLPGSWLSGSVPSPDLSFERRETISLAFMIALQKLNVRQRVVLILREVFNWRADEVAEALGLTVASINNHLYRARKTLELSQHEDVEASNLILDDFVNAWESGDLVALIGLLHEKANFAMPPMGVWYSGRDAIQRALQNYVFISGVKWKLLATSANGRPAYGMYQHNEGELGAYQPTGLILPIFSTEKGHITELTAFLSPSLVKRFDLPASISA